MSSTYLEATILSVMNASRTAAMGSHSREGGKLIQGSGISYIGVSDMSPFATSEVSVTNTLHLGRCPSTTMPGMYCRD